MNRRTIRLAAAGSAVAVTMLAGGTAFAATSNDAYLPGGGGGNTGGTGGTGGTGNNGGTGGTGVSGGGGSATFTSNGGALTSGGGAGTSSTSSSGSNLPFTGFELATALTLGVGAIGAGSIVVVSSRRKRDTSAVA